jgi:AbiV family abortive infection protein
MNTKNDDKEKYYVLTKDQLSIGVCKCLENVKGLLSEALLLTQFRSQYAVGLYIVAVEEFGKALLLMHTPANEKRPTTYKVRRNLFRGHTAHEEKINVAINKLPDICRNIFANVTEIPTSGKKSNILKNRMWKYRNVVVPLPRGIRGNFIVSVKVGRDMLEDSFYIDWDKQNNKWRFAFSARADKLRTAIQSFQAYLEETEKASPPSVTTSKNSP